jgi:apoptosis-inducing factor 3
MDDAMMSRNMTYILAGGAVAVAIAVVFIVSRTRSKLGKYAIPDAASILPGKMKTVKIDGRDVLLIRTSKGQLRATGAKCPHYNLPLSGGVVSEDRVVCNYHGACFSTKTGDIEDGPGLDRIPVYAVTESPDGSCFVSLPTEGDLSKPIVPHMCPADSADRRHFVVIGAGPAAQTCAETLRQEGFGGQITLLTREAVGRPYDRVKLSKDLSVTHEKAALRTSDFFRENSISVRTQVRVTSVLPAERTVVLEHGERITYDKLLCASGGPPRLLPGCDALANIFPLRDVSHSAGIQGVLRAFGGKARVVIVGSSFIGMEAASYLLSNKAAASVTVIGMEATPFERVLGPRVGSLMQRLYESRGVVFRMVSTVYSFNAGKGAGSSSGLANVGSVTVIPFVPGAKPPTPPVRRGRH